MEKTRVYVKYYYIGDNICVDYGQDWQNRLKKSQLRPNVALPG